MKGFEEIIGVATGYTTFSILSVPVWPMVSSELIHVVFGFIAGGAGGLGAYIVRKYLEKKDNEKEN